MVLNLRRKRSRVFPVEAPLDALAWKEGWTSSGGGEDDAATRSTLLRQVAARGLQDAARGLAWPTMLTCAMTSPTKSSGSSSSSPAMQQAAIHGLQLVKNANVADADPLLAAWYSHQGGTEEWAFTLQRIGTDADRLTHAPAFLAAGTASRADAIACAKRVLALYALCDARVGYCQGMSDLVAPLLQVYPAANDADPVAVDVNVFLCFRDLMQHFRRCFLPGLVTIHEDMAALRDVVRRMDSQLHSHLERAGAGGYEFTFQMLLLLLRRELAWEEANKLWDALLAWHQLLHTELVRECDTQCCDQEAVSNQQDGGGRHVPAALSECLATLSLAPSGTQLRYPSYARDLFRELRVAAAAALLAAHRAPLMGCASVEAVVQLANALPELGPGSGARIADDAAHILRRHIQHLPEPDKSSPSCGCV